MSSILGNLHFGRTRPQLGNRSGVSTTSIGVAALALILVSVAVPARAAVQGSGVADVPPLQRTPALPYLPQAAAPTASTGPWTQILDDEFNGTAVNPSVWRVWDNPTGKVHLARNVVVANGIVSLKTVFDATLNKWSTAGMRTVPALSRTYGKYEMSVRTSAGDSRVVALLWPDTTGVWPPEIDWMEMDGLKPDQAGRQRSTQTVHYGTLSQNFMIHTSHAADMTAWHTVGLEWGPGFVRYLLDGVVTDQVISQNVSNQVMYLGIQTSPEGSTAPTVPVNMDIDWLRVYSYGGGAGMAPTQPLNVSATGGDASATVTWDPPASEGNSLVSSYTVTASPGGQTKTVSYVSPNPPATQASFTGLTPGLTYTFTVTATNPFGTSGPSAPSAGVSVTGTPPSITSPPTVALVKNSVVGATPASPALSTTVTYAATAGSSAICSYQLQRSTNAGAWVDVALRPWAPTVAKEQLPSTGLYQYRAQATGCDGLQSGWVDGPGVDYALLPETALGITYGGAWTAVNCPSCLSGSATSTSATGASAVIPTSASQVGIVATTGPNQGAAKLYVDGVYQAMIFTQASTTVCRKLVYIATSLSAGPHVVTLENLATPGHPRLDLDGVVELATVATPSAAATGSRSAGQANRNRLFAVEGGDTVLTGVTLPSWRRCAGRYGVRSSSDCDSRSRPA